MPELLEVFTEAGEPTGIYKTKQAILEAGKWRLVIHVWIVDHAGNLLVQQRTIRGKNIFDGLWDVSVGGGVSAGEDPRVCAQRETKEELGLSFSFDQFLYVGRTKIAPKDMGDGRVMCDFSDDYVVVVPSIDLSTVTVEPAEVQTVTTMPLAKLLEDLRVPAIYAQWVPHGRSYYSNVAHKLRERMEGSNG